METNNKNNGRRNIRQIIGVAVLSMIVCGLFFPVLVTAVGQALFPYQANGELATLNGKTVGSYLIAQGFTQPVFFHPRNSSDSASGVDPDITLQDAMSQVPGISNATGISVSWLQQFVNQNVDPQGKVVGVEYVDVLTLNIQLIQDYPTVYAAYA